MSDADTDTRNSSGPAAAASGSRTHRPIARWLTRRLATSPNLLLVVVLVVFVLYGATQSEQFLVTGTWINILRNAVFISIVGSFTTLVFVSGGLDLSVGSVFVAGAVAGAAAAHAGWSAGAAFAAAVAIGMLAGLINGVLINNARIPAFIATLGMLFGARSLVVFATGGRPIAPLPESFTSVGQGEFLGLPLLIYYAAAVAVVVHVALEYTVFGTRMRALGGDREAAHACGIRVDRLSTVVYTLSGASAGLAGGLMAARLGSGTPSLGNGFELQVIAAAIIGGTSLFGAIGSIPGTVLGALLLSVLTTGLVLIGTDPVLQNFALGVIMVVAVGLDQYRRRNMFQYDPEGES